MTSSTCRAGLETRHGRHLASPALVRDLRPGDLCLDRLYQRRCDINDDHADASSLVRSVCLPGPVLRPWGPRPVVPPDRSVGTRRPSSSGVVLAGSGLALGVHRAWRPAEHTAHLRLTAPGHALREIAQGARPVPDPANRGVARHLAPDRRPVARPQAGDPRE
jgi:hypothetical protein